MVSAAVLTAAALVALTACAGPVTDGRSPDAPPPPGAPVPDAPQPDAREPAPAPVGAGTLEGGLPPIPRVEGPLDLRVSYPRPGVAIATRDRTFVFGSAGSGDARVWIDGTEVDVRPNGGFLAFPPVPPDGVYRLRATLDGREETLEVEVPVPPALPAGDVVIDPGSVRPSGGWMALPGERIEASFRGTPGGTARLVFADGVRVPLVEGAPAGEGATDFEMIPPADVERPAPADTADEDRLVPYRGFFTARRIVSADTAVAWPALATEERPAGGGAAADRPPHVELTVDGQTVRRPVELNLLLVDPDRPRVGRALDPRPPERNGDAHVIARPGPGGGPYHYVWPNGTELEITGEREAAYRVRLTDDLSAWTPTWDIELRPPGAAPPEARIATVRMAPGPEHVDVHLATDRRLPYRVDEAERSVTLTVYGGLSRVNFLQHGRLDPYVVRGEWSQPADRLFRLDLRLSALPWGYETFRSEADDLVLRLRRPPAVDPEAPLRGLTVGVDAGHGGEDRTTMGPTGFTEADANLGITLALRDELETRGARVVMTRTTDATVSLVERTNLARAEDVDVWISVHNNAFPDGVDPFENAGTSVYYNHANSAGLARAVHRELLAELGLRDLGVGRADLHQARFTWAPAILTETAYMMIPEHEAFLKTEEGQRRIARAHVRGLEAWLRGRAAP